MPLLFSYGSLQQEKVQLSTFGRTLTGQPDELPGFETSSIRIVDAGDLSLTGMTHYANARISGRDEDRVAGTVFGVTEAELEAADVYEQPAGYVRTRVTLASGTASWVYVHGGR